MDFLKHYVWPMMVIGGAPVALQLLMNYPRDSSMEGIYPVDEELEGFKLEMLYGNHFAWIFTILWISWIVFFLAIPFDHFFGRKSLFGTTPMYVHNGIQLYVTNFLAFLMFHSFYPHLCYKVYVNLPYIVGTFNIIGFLVAMALWIKGDSERLHLEKSEGLPKVPYFYELFRGIQLHPRYFGIDVKQFLVRFGFMTWQMLALCYMMVGYLQHGFDAGMIAHVVIQCTYLFYFFLWEKGYFIALDMTYGRAGFYFCWGCTNWIPFFYSYSTYYLVSHHSGFGYLEAAAWIIVSIFIIRLKHSADEQKFLFREKNGINCQIWGKEASYVEVGYNSSEGFKTSKLLTSGFWGMARHLNYTLEILCALTWTLMTYRVSTILTFLYPLYLFVLLIHRTYRDDEKCRAKYGATWQEYCNIVKYKLIPHLF